MFTKFRATTGRAIAGPRAVRLTLVNAKNGLFYATSTGNTEEIAGLIKEKLGDAIEGPLDPEGVRTRL